MYKLTYRTYHLESQNEIHSKDYQYFLSKDLAIKAICKWNKQQPKNWIYGIVSLEPMTTKEIKESSHELL